MDQQGVISFSLWGDQPRYRAGVLANYSLAKELFPGFKVVLHVDSIYTPDALMDFQFLDIEFVSHRNLAPFHGAFWRFFSCELPGVVLVRDLDSRLSTRERDLVMQWIDSGKKFHIIRDHPEHRRPMAAGMWGCRGGIPEICQMVDKFGVFQRYGDDEHFLETFIFPVARHDCLEHSSTDYHATDSFVAIPKDPDGRYIGERYSEENHPI